MKSKNFPLGRVNAKTKKTISEQSTPTGTPKVPGKLYWVPGTIKAGTPAGTVFTLEGSWQYIDDTGAVRILQSDIEYTPPPTITP